MQRIGQKEKRRKIILRHQNLMVTITTKSTYIRIHTYTYKRIFIHAYGYITRAFNRSEERLIHRQRLTSVDRRCSTKFSSLSLSVSRSLTSFSYLRTNDRFNSGRRIHSDRYTFNRKRNAIHTGSLTHSLEYNESERERTLLNESQEKH